MASYGATSAVRTGRFGGARTLDLPTPIPAGLSQNIIRRTDFYPNWTQGSSWHSLRDLDGDGRPELIQTADDHRDGSHVFRDQAGAFWKVWRSQATGFNGQFTRWTVPDSGLNDGFFTLTWARGQRWFTVMDLDGDGRSDLVQTADPARDGGHVWSDQTGAYWKVWLGQAQGFAPTHRRWPVPASGLSDGFFFTHWTMGERSFSTLDMNGDGRVDMVQTADPQRAGGYVHTDENGAFWRVWLNDGNRFSEHGQRWSVPDSGLADGFFTPWYQQGERGFATMDLTGDGLPDLIQTADNARPGGHIWRDASGPFWKVWVGSPNGCRGIAALAGTRERFQ